MSAPSTTTALEDVLRFGVVPVIVLSEASKAEALGEALLDGGLPIAEVTLRTRDALECISTMAGVDGLLVGAGTITRPEQVEPAVSAGARFLVSPGCTAEIILEAGRLGVPLLPGIATPTDLLTALRHGIGTVKFFPAEQSGGLPALTALASVGGDTRFVPTGGIGPTNVAQYLAAPFVAAVGGSWMVPADALHAGDFARVTAMCRDANQTVSRSRTSQKKGTEG